jgi:hypothetical protein
MALAGWYPDPLGRGQVRYWDGNTWSPWVANDGASRLDADAPLAGLPAPSDVAPPPAPSAPTQYAWVAAPAPQFRSLRGLAIALTWVLVGVIAVSLALAGVLYHRLDVADRYFHGDLAAVTDLHHADDAVSGFSAAGGALTLAVFVLVIVLLYRAAKNTELWNTARARWTPGWTIGGWFIPVANFVIPFLVIRDIWRRTTESMPNGLLWAWWLLFLGGRAVMFVDPGDSTLHDIRVRDGFDIAGELLLVVSAILLISWVWRLTRAQHDRSVPVSL